ncbi:hypothetical protein SDC9_06521 [bioreactor metagenome]|uniref:Flagellar basal body rod protein N-terminal domain-containing protein n=1 Tax=bioreactor metagenome TaxID=1076179 RepID=A0A644T254_9ZZZZ
MFEKIQLLQMAQSMARQAAFRQNAVAQNVANADTPGYRALDVPSFAETYQDERTTPMRATRAGHLGAANKVNVAMAPDPDAAAMSPDGNSVSLEDEMVKSAEVQRSHNLALAVYRSSLDILRTSLGGK